MRAKPSYILADSLQTRGLHSRRLVRRRSGVHARNDAICGFYYQDKKSVCTLSRTPTYRLYPTTIRRTRVGRDTTRGGKQQRTHLFFYGCHGELPKLTVSAVIELENEYQRLQQGYQLFIDRMLLFSNHLNVVHEETRQYGQNVRFAAGEAVNLDPKLDTVGCKLFSIFDLSKSKEARRIEKLLEEKQRNNRNMDWLNIQTGRAVKFLGAE